MSTKTIKHICVHLNQVEKIIIRWRIN